MDREADRQVSSAKAQKWCQDNGGLLYFEVSAKDNVMLEDMFQMIADRMHERRIRMDQEVIM